VSKLIKSLMDACSGDLQVGSSAQYAAELTATDEFLLPKCIGLGEASIETFWHEEVMKMCQNLKELVAAKMEKATKAINKKGGTHACIVFEDVANFSFASEESKVFTVEPVLPPTLYVQKNFYADFTIEASPLQGIAQIITVVSGKAFVLTIDATATLESGSFKSYLDSLGGETRSLTKTPHFIVEASMSVYVPLGWYALVIGIGGDTSKAESDEGYVGFLVNYAFDATKTAGLSGDLKAELAALMTKVLAKKLQPCHSKRAELNKWKASLDEQ
jgi:hypothetical protein